MTISTETVDINQINLKDYAGVGQGIVKSMADDLRTKIKQTPTTPHYERKEAAELPFELLKSHSIAAVIKPAVDTWIEDVNNIERISQRFKIKSFKLQTWSVLRTRAIKTPKKIKGGIFNNKNQIAIFIALGDWNKSNGIFTVGNWAKAEDETPHSSENDGQQALSYIELKSGEDVSVGGADTLFFPGKEGGLAIMLRLDFLSFTERVDDK